MSEITTYSVSILIAILPLLIAIYFLVFTRPRKRVEIHQDLRKLRSGKIIGTAGVRSRNPETTPADNPPPPSFDLQKDDLDIDELFDEYWSAFVLLIPVTILTLLYLAGFLLCDSYLFHEFKQKWATVFFSEGFLDASHSANFAFIGVYLFNLGNIVRRQYLADLNEHVFWGAINRLLLSMGLALVFVNQPYAKDSALEAGFFFVIGFMANLLIDYLVDKALKALNYSSRKRDDLPLQMVRGINLWKEYRLEEEGIESVQNLATANLIELTVHTHYNLRTLIDWIDQAIVLSRFTIEHVTTMSNQSVAISAMELAAASPEYRGGDTTLSDALAVALNIEKSMMANTLNMLFEDTYVRQLWREWQSGRGALPPAD